MAGLVDIQLERDTHVAVRRRPVRQVKLRKHRAGCCRAIENQTADLPDTVVRLRRRVQEQAVIHFDGSHDGDRIPLLYARPKAPHTDCLDGFFIQAQA
jgi:hypothetical protein